MNTKGFLSLNFTRSLFAALTCQLLFFFQISNAISSPDLRNLVFEPTAFTEDESISSSKGGSSDNLFEFDKYLSISTLYPTSDHDLDYNQLIDAQLTVLSRLEDSQGPYGAGLQDELLDLAGLYQDSGQHELALDVYQKALQVSKINKGLFHEEQIAIVKSYVQSLMALGNYQLVHEQLEFLIYLHQKCYGLDSPKLVEPLADKVAWDLQVYESIASRNAFNSGNANMLAANYSSPLDGAGAQFGILAQTQETIIKAIHILVNAGEFSNPYLQEFEEQLIATYFYQARQVGIHHSQEHLLNTLEGSYMTARPFDLAKANFQNGELAYHRLLAYLDKSQQTDSMAYLQAVVGLGDWYMLFGKRQRAQEQYALVRALVETSDISPRDKAAILEPSVPMALPAFSSPLFSSASNTGFVVHSGGRQGSDVNNYSKNYFKNYDGYIDVAFDLTSYGKVKKYESLAASPGTHKDVITELEWKLRDTQFRPILAGAGEGQVYPQKIRYYYKY